MSDSGRQKEAEGDPPIAELKDCAVRLEALAEALDRLREQLEFYVKAEQRHMLN